MISVQINNIQFKTIYYNHIGVMIMHRGKYIIWITVELLKLKISIDIDSIYVQHTTILCSITIKSFIRYLL